MRDAKDILEDLKEAESQVEWYQKENLKLEAEIRRIKEGVKGLPTFQTRDYDTTILPNDGRVIEGKDVTVILQSDLDNLMEGKK